MALPRPALVALSQFLDPDRILFLSEGTTKQQALERLAERCAASPAVADAHGFITAIFERERVSSTGIGGGIAVPHAKLGSITGFAIAIGISHAGIDFEAKDDQDVHILVMIAASEHERETYLRVLATVASTLKRDNVISAIRSATAPAQVLEAMTSG
jgi:mannitol/fructose-specific phosphotransferase system IIA component (Ntr-type)